MEVNEDVASGRDLFTKFRGIGHCHKPTFHLITVPVPLLEILHLWKAEEKGKKL